MQILYRISNGSYNKDRIATKEQCLRNFISVFMDRISDQLYILMDNCNEETQTMITKVCVNTLGSAGQTGWKPQWTTIPITGGSSAQSFNNALNLAIAFDESDYVYFVEDDFLHWPDSRHIMGEGVRHGHYVSLYDHPDKYLNAEEGGNPHVDDGGEITRVILTESTHWKLTNSTTMTFAAPVRIIQDDEVIWRRYTTGTYPRDFDAFIELRNRGRTLITPIPGYATHTERAWLAPLRDWSTML